MTTAGKHQLLKSVVLLSKRTSVEREGSMLLGWKSCDFLVMSKAINILLNRVKTWQAFAHEYCTTDTRTHQSWVTKRGKLDSKWTDSCNKARLTVYSRRTHQFYSSISWKLLTFRTIFIKVIYDNIVPLFLSGVNFNIIFPCTPR